MSDRFVETGISTDLSFEVRRGVDWLDSVTLYQPIPVGTDFSEALFDLTGARLTLAIQDAFINPTVIDTLDTLTGEFPAGDETGIADIYVPGWRVASWPLGTWVFVWTALKLGKYIEVARGPILIHPHP